MVPSSNFLSFSSINIRCIALHWLQENVAEFGGDPTSVTLMGHGTGAACATFLMTSPAVLDGKSIELGSAGTPNGLPARYLACSLPFSWMKSFPGTLSLGSDRKIVFLLYNTVVQDDSSTCWNRLVTSIQPFCRTSSPDKACKANITRDSFQFEPVASNDQYPIYLYRKII